MSCKLNPYLNFEGSCEEAFTLYAQAFGGQPQYLRMGDMPNVPEQYKDKIMHVALKVGGDTLMGSDVLPGCGLPFARGNNQYVTIHPADKAEADRLFALLSQGGAVEMPMSDQFFGYFGSFTDRFGVAWMIHVAASECGCTD